MPGSYAIGSADSQLGSVTLGNASPAAAGTVGVRARPASARELIVTFTEPVTADALSASRYALWSLSPGAARPDSAVVSFRDPDHTSVLLTFDYGLTSGLEYSIQASQSIRTESGGLVSSAGANFTATVADHPVPCGAFLSRVGFLDLTFDRDVGAFSTAANASVSADGGAPVALALEPWAPHVPSTSVRFALGAFPSGSSYVISYTGVRDASLNDSSGSTPLSVPWDGPHTLASLTTPVVRSSRIASSHAGSRTTRAEILFSCPMDSTAGSATATMPHSHLAADTVNTAPAAPVTDLASFYAAMATVYVAYNAHRLQDGVHRAPPRLPSLSSLCSVVNDAVAKFNDHVLDPGAHSAVVRSDVVSSPPARDLATAAARLQDLADRFNDHRVRSVGGSIHLIDDTHYAALALPSPGTVLSLSDYADDLKTRTAMHAGLKYHPAVRESSVPSPEYCTDKLAYALASTIHDCCAGLHEASFKLKAHMSGAGHSYPFAHAYDLARVDFSDPASAMAVADELVARYSEHASGSGYSVPVDLVDMSQSSGPSDFPSDCGSYLAVVVIGNSSPAPSVSVAFTGLAHDATAVSETTSAAAAAPAPITAFQSPGEVAVRYFGRAAEPDVRVVRASGPPVPSSSSTAMSPQALATACWDLARAYNLHVTSAAQYDSGNNLLPEQHVAGFVGDPIDLAPYGAGLADAILVLNEVYSRYNLHLSDSNHFSLSAGGALSSGPASSNEEASALAEALRAGLLSHDSNSSQHSRPGWCGLPGSFQDVVLVSVPGLLHGDPVSVTVSRPGLPDDEVAITAWSVGPSVASAEVVPGYDPRRRTLGPDQMVVTFSKPMATSAVSPSDFSVTGGSVTVSSASWASPRDAVLQISGTETGTSYVVDASGLTDEAGNALVP